MITIDRVEAGRPVTRFPGGDLPSFLAACEASGIMPDLVETINRMKRRGASRNLIFSTLAWEFKKAGHWTPTFELALWRFLVFSMPNKVTFDVQGV
jgi:hypothetical protein